MRASHIRALFWLVALVVAPLAGFFSGVAVSGSGKTSDVVAWVLIFGLPAALTAVAGLGLSVRKGEVAVAAGLSTGMSALALVALLWYLFEVVGVS